MIAGIVFPAKLRWLASLISAKILTWGSFQSKWQYMQQPVHKPSLCLSAKCTIVDYVVVMARGKRCLFSRSPMDRNLSCVKLPRSGCITAVRVTRSKTSASDTKRLSVNGISHRTHSQMTATSGCAKCSERHQSGPSASKPAPFPQSCLTTVKHMIQTGRRAPSKGAIKR